MADGGIEATQARRAVAPPRAVLWAAAALAAAFADERERWPLWLPVAGGAGILPYFALPAEPDGWTGPAVALCLGVAILLMRGRPMAPVVLAAMFAAGVGFSAAQLGTARAMAPMLEGRIGPAWVEGRVVAQSLLPSGVRVVLADLVLRGVAPERTPDRVRVRLTSGAAPVPTGSRIGLRAVLNPPSRPVVPGGFDFRRHAFFQGIGGIGYAVGRPQLFDRAEAGGASLWLEITRRGIAERIARHLDGDAAAVATALMTGDRGAIRADVHDAIRQSGLAHLLAISGLHLGLVAGLIFFAVRAGLALVPAVALRWPIKKWAAAAALAGAFGYMLIVGSTVPTQRAFAMAGLVLLAVLVDRTAISMRLVAWAAALVLVLSPYSLLGPSFQMSFAAVIALIAGYEALRGRLTEWRRRAGWAGMAGLYLAGVLLTTAIASVATAPFALYHFQQIATFGLATNLLAVPLTALWIMPWGVAAYLLMPVGLEEIALVPMGWGIEALVGIAEAAAGWPNAALRVPAPPGWALGLACIGGLWLCLWRGPWRFGGTLAIAAGLIGLVLPGPRPDLLISDTGSLMAVRSADGPLTLSSTRRDRFIADIWLRDDGQSAAESWPAGVSADGLMSCDPLACLYRRDGLVIALIRDPRALTEDCAVAVIVVASVPVPRFCRADIVVDRFDVWRHGAHAVFLTDAGPRIERAADAAGDRPWALRRGRD